VVTSAGAEAPRVTGADAPMVKRRVSGRLPLRAGLTIALAWVSFALFSMRHYGVTVDSPGLFYAGDRALFWAQHRQLPNVLALAAKVEPAGFHSVFGRYPDFADPMHYPVLPGFVGAVTDAIFDGGLHMLGPLDGHQLGLVLIHALCLVLYCVYASKLLGPLGGISATIMLALFPCAIGHAFNNAKDWPCAMFYGIAVLSAGVGVIQARYQDVAASGLYLGLALSCKMNGAFVLPTIALWLPIAWLVLYRRRRRVPAALAGWLAAAPYIALTTFFVLWPWLYEGHSVFEWWTHLQDYVTFFVHYGVGDRATWTNYPIRCLAYMTPPLVLALASIQLLLGFGDRVRIARGTLLIVWLALPLVRTAMPRSNFYDANRHFIEYVPALCAVAGGGVTILVERLRAVWQLSVWVFDCVGTLAVGVLVWPIIVYHPFETTYFNAFIGGLGGAERRHLFAMQPPHDYRVNGTEGDYWYSSYRDGLHRVYEATKGRSDFSVSTCQPFTALEATALEWPSDRVPTLAAKTEQADYIVLIPRPGSQCSFEDIDRFAANRPVLERVTREGGLVYEVVGPRRKR
jgi:Dolichyl-phosphate-mannose-protein mannosyltransferase